MRYQPHSLAIDYLRLQYQGNKFLDNLDPYRSNQGIHAFKKKLKGRLGMMAIVGAFLYEIAHAEDSEKIDPDLKTRASLQGAYVNGLLDWVDDVIDHKDFPLELVSPFLENCFQVILTDKIKLILPCQYQVLEHNIYQVTRDLSTHFDWKRRKDQDELVGLIQRVIDLGIRQKSEQNLENLLQIGIATHGFCAELFAEAIEATDGIRYPHIRKIAWHFGAQGGALDHGTEIVEDLQHGNQTFATQMINNSGKKVDKELIYQVRQKMALTVQDNYITGLSHLQSKRQKSIYTMASQGIRAHHKRRSLLTFDEIRKINALVPADARSRVN